MIPVGSSVEWPKPKSGAGPKVFYAVQLLLHI